MENEKIKALIVDDSMLFREVISKLVAEDDEINVVATAGDAYEARDKILEFRPQALTLDIEMPKMDGIKFLKKLIPQYPVPVVVVTALPINAFEALDAGAVDFIKKPLIKGPDDLKKFAIELREKIRIAGKSKVILPKKSAVSQAPKSYSAINKSNIDIIAIGASTGGPEAITKVLQNLPASTPPVVITQHMPPKFTEMFAQRLNRLSQMEVREAKDGDRLETGVAIVAAGDNHMRVKKDSQGYYISSKMEEKVSGHCPSVDVLFESVAIAAKGRAVGVILTGMGSDGAKGLFSMKNAGAFTIGQDMESSVVYGMPKVAFTSGAVITQCPLENISDLIYKQLQNEKSV